MKVVSRLCAAVLALGVATVFLSDALRPPFHTTTAAALLPGTAQLIGTVDAPALEPFQAAQVYIRNHERRMLYMVYTNKGKFRAVALFPGTYEVSVTARGLQSDAKTITVKAGDTGQVHLALQPTGERIDPRSIAYNTAGSGPGFTPATTEYLPYDQIYPAGPGRAIVERTCITCHGPNFLPTKRWNEAQWNAGLDLMFGKGGEREAKRRAGTYLASTSEIAKTKLNDQDRATVLRYLVESFGPGSTLRAVRVTKEQPIDEAKIANALHIEYYFPVDPPGQGVNAPEYSKTRARGRWGQAPRFDSRGNVWLTDRGYPNRLVKLDPRTGHMKEWLRPNPLAGIHDIYIDKNDVVYLPEHSGEQPFAKKYLDAFDSKTETWERYPLDPDNVIKTPDGSKWPQSINADSKGNIYVGWINGGAISKFDPRTKKVTVYTPPSWPMRFYGVIVDRSDNVWSPYYLDGRMARLNTTTGKWTEHTPSMLGQIRRPIADAQNNVWFGIWASGKLPGKLVKLDAETGTMTDYELPHENASPYDTAVDPAGNIWLADAGQGGTLIKFDPRTASFTFYPSPQVSDKPKAEITKDGAIWYSPRQSTTDPGFGVLYPDMDRIATLAAFPQ